MSWFFGMMPATIPVWIFWKLLRMLADLSAALTALWETIGGIVTAKVFCRSEVDRQEESGPERSLTRGSLAFPSSPPVGCRRSVLPTPDSRIQEQIACSSPFRFAVQPAEQTVASEGYSDFEIGRAHV